VVDSHLAPNSYPAYTYLPSEGKYFALLEPAAKEVYTTLSQSFSAQAGQVVSCWTFFDGEDVAGYNDHGDVRILQGTTPVATVYHEDIISAGDPGNLPWSHWAYTVTVAGSYTIEARIANAKDDTFPSYLGLDGCSFPTSFSLYLPLVSAR
jgi:hypothetical protein